MNAYGEIKTEKLNFVYNNLTCKSDSPPEPRPQALSAAQSRCYHPGAAQRRAFDRSKEAYDQYSRA
jgi:hypothetical protein